MKFKWLAFLLLLHFVSFGQQKEEFKNKGKNSFDIFLMSNANLGKEIYDVNLGANYSITETLDVRIQTRKNYFTGGLALNPLGKKKLYPSLGVLTGYDSEVFKLEIPLTLHYQFINGFLVSLHYQHSKNIVVSRSSTNYFGISVGWHFDL
jgi:hypothetical protein